MAVEFRWAEWSIDRLPELAAELVRRRVTVIVTGGSTAATLAVKAATTTIPIVFATAEDPLKFGLVSSFNLTGRKSTGVSVLFNALVAKRLELLRELVPRAATVALLIDPSGAISEPALKEVEAAARTLGLPVQVETATNGREIDAAFARFASARPTPSSSRATRFQPGGFNWALAARHALPMSYSTREFVEAGGLFSYGNRRDDACRQIGVYAGRILKGEKPTNLPVQQPSRFELIINAQTAKAPAAWPARRGRATTPNIFR